jgi:hypothetical protein
MNLRCGTDPMMRLARGVAVRWRVLALPLLLALAASPARAVDAPSAPDMTAVSQAVIRRLDLQLELPREAEGLSWSIPLPPALFWSLVVLAAVLLLYYLAIYVLPGLQGARPARWQETLGGGESGVPASETEVAEADALARQGRFGEAMHALLLHGLMEIRRRLDEKFADSLTSREIRHSIRLSDRGRAALSDIVARVERCYFGEYPASASDYQGCRASFDALAAVLRMDGAA